MAQYKDEDWLRQRYWNDGATQAEIAAECGVSPSTIRTYMKQFDIPTRNIEGENHPLYETERSEEVKRNISETMEGREFSDEWRRRLSKAQMGSETPADVRRKISRALSGSSKSKTTREKMSKSSTGEQNSNWKGGYSRRYGSGWAIANEEVRERDGSCQRCGHDGTERRLEVHHIVPVRRFRESDSASLPDAHDLRNLVLLCNRCHAKADHGTIEVPTPDGFDEWRTDVEL